ncbi:Cu,Zn superoxide dismutase-like protein [Clathrospora elynae]|uniref:superoxide dismutase n=1 Tax=Clathrospora elynae TaxID=706981 RepID=A0A6A5SFY2_9PLEO|nr:Cu,Zn superoxide dismutase-like protein [Clathrospora elynae]
MLSSIVSILAAATAVVAQSSTGNPAPRVANNPIGAQYVATLPLKADNPLVGSIQGSTAADGKGVKFDVSFAGLPETGGPFIYHIHAKPVPADGNCTGTGAHLDPYLRGEAPACDASKPETCQIGDLSGKHGNITDRSFAAAYTDLYLATLPSDPAFFGHLSFVVHLSNKTRIGCANFTMVAAGMYPSGSPVPSGVASSSGMIPYPSDAPLYNSTMSASSSATSAVNSPVSPTSAASSTPQASSNAVAKVASSAGVLLAAAAALVL